MRGIHFSLRWLFGVVSFLAIGCGLLIYASPFLAKLTATFSAVAILAAVPAAIYHAGDRRAFWAGFAFFGFAYLWMACGTWMSHDGSSALRERLVTTDVLVQCYEVLPASQASAAAGSVSTVGYAGMAGRSATPSELALRYLSTRVTMGSFATPAVDQTNFLTTGHSLFAILFALLGSAISRRCSSRARSLPVHHKSGVVRKR